MALLFEEIAGNLRKSLQEDREIVQADRGTLAGYFRRATRELRKIVALLVQDGRMSYGLLLDLFWKATLNAVDRFGGALDSTVQQAEAGALARLEKAEAKHAKQLE